MLTQTRLTRRWVLASTVTSAGTAAFVAACGNSGQGRGKKSPSSTDAAGKPAHGGRIVLRVTTDPFDWDTTYGGNTSPNGEGAALSYECLLGFKYGPGVKYGDSILEPRLAERWESPDGATYIFHMRPGVRFAATAPVNGRQLIADDIRWSYAYQSRTGEFSKLGKSTSTSDFTGLVDLQAPDPNTAVVRFGQPYAPFVAAVAAIRPILAHEIYDQDGNFKSRMVGTGPWTLDVAGSQKGNRWRWNKNADYWKSGQPYMDGIDWLILPDDATAYSAFQAGQLDIVKTLDSSPAEALKRSVPKAVEAANLAFSTGPIYMNAQQPPLNDLRVRQAIGYSIDRDAFIKALTAGQGGWAAAGAFPNTFTQPEIKQMLKFDPAHAKQLLNQAGYSNGLDMDMIYPGSAYGEAYVTKIQLLQAQLAKTGIRLSLKTMDKNEYASRRRDGKFTILSSNEIEFQGDIDSALYTKFHPDSTGNYGRVNDPALTQLLDAQRRETDPAKRADIVRQAVRLINVDQVWGLALYYPVEYQFWNPAVENYAPRGGLKGWVLTDTWLTSR